MIIQTSIQIVTIISNHLLAKHFFYRMNTKFKRKKNPTNQMNKVLN